MNTTKKNNLFRKICAVLLSVLVLVSFNGCSGKAKADKVFRVGILSGLDYLMVASEAFKEELTKLGYTEGENIIYDIQSTNSDLEDYKKISQKFVEDNVDLIFCYPTEAALELKEITKGTEIPVIFGVTNIEDTNLVNSVREPGGNVTGVRYPGPDIAVKRFEVMLQIVPEAKKICLPYSDLPVCYPQLEALRPVAQEAGITLIEVPAKTPQELNDFFAKQDVEGEVDFDAILSIAEAYAVMPETFLTMIKFANKHDIPMGGAYMEAEGYSSLFGVNINPIVTGQKAAVLADKILKGQNVSTVSVISDESFVQLNYKEAQKRGYNMPDDLLSQATEIIK
jgi:putative ABC transport system substrate-binding protein